MAESRRNRWVYPADEVRRIESRYSGGEPSGYVARAAQAFYLTDPDAVAELLPPPLQPADRPEVWVSIGEISQIGLGTAQVAVRCDYRGEQGYYCLLLPMNAEPAVVGGRERFGENKKLAEIRFSHDGGTVHGTVTRYGTTFLELRGDVVEPLEPPAEEVVPHYYFKYLLAADGNGYDFPPALVRSVHTRHGRRLERLDGKVVLRDSATDPVADLPVRELTAMFFTERTTAARASVVEHVAGDDFLPYVYQRYDFPGAG